MPENFSFRLWFPLLVGSGWDQVLWQWWFTRSFDSDGSLGPLTLMVRWPQCGFGVDSACNRNEYPVYHLG